MPGFCGWGLNAWFASWRSRRAEYYLLDSLMSEQPRKLVRSRCAGLDDYSCSWANDTWFLPWDGSLYDRIGITGPGGSFVSAETPIVLFHLACILNRIFPNCFRGVHTFPQVVFIFHRIPSGVWTRDQLQKVSRGWNYHFPGICAQLPHATYSWYLLLMAVAISPSWRRQAAFD